MAPSHQINPRTKQPENKSTCPGDLGLSRIKSASADIRARTQMTSVSKQYIDQLSKAITSEQKANKKLRSEVDELRSNIEKQSSAKWAHTTMVVFASFWKVSSNMKNDIKDENPKKEGKGKEIEKLWEKMRLAERRSVNSVAREMKKDQEICG